MRTKARFPDVPEKAGHYESFYLKLTQPGGGRGAWIRHTVHKRPGEAPTCALWFVLFDSSAAGPRATKRQFGADELAAAPDSYIRVADATLTDGHATGRDRDGRARGQVGPELCRLARALSPPTARLPLPHPASQDQVPEPVPGRGLQRAAGGGRGADRGRGVARDDRPQLGRRARRALGLGSGLRLRGPLARGLLRHGGRPDQVGRSDHPVGRQRDADAGRHRRIGSAASATSRAPRSQSSRRARASSSRASTWR